MSAELEAQVLAEAKKQDRSASYVIVKALERALSEVGNAQAGRNASGHDVARASSLTSAAPARTPPRVSDRAARQAKLNKAKGMA